ncbi:MAG: TonB-dependent receptor [Flavobacterium sp.]|nr:TonB-dependent receptor [Flavobacterium sp.]
MKKIIVLQALFFGTILQVTAQENTKKAEELKEVTITKTKKAVEQRADRTIFDFANQPSLSSGSVLEGLKKLPGLIASDIAGMMYQGKQLDVYMDGRPLNISSNELNGFLEGMPANAIEKIEIITQPGAEFPATSGGAILNIITNKNAKNFLSATYTNSTNVTNYDRLRWRVNNSVLLNAKNKYFGWQLNMGQNYRESAMWSSFVNDVIGGTRLLSATDSDRTNRTNFVKSAMTFDLKKDRLLLNYDVNYNNNGSDTQSNGPGFSTQDASNSKGWRQDAVATYQKRFDDKTKKLDFRFNFNRNQNDFVLNSLGNVLPVLDNSSDQKYYNFKFDYSQPIAFSDEGKISFGSLHEGLSFETQNRGVTNLDYERKTTAGYFELQTKFKSMSFILGGRAEDYSISGKANNTVLTPFKQFRFFPNASAQYNFNKSVFFNVNYNKKITLPSTSALNPNNTSYQNPNISNQGNPNLQPTIYDNYEVKLSAYDYAFIGYSVSSAKNQVIQRVNLNSNVVNNTNENISELKVHNFNIGMPIPYMLFTKGLAETMKMNVNPDEMNFLFVYAAYQLHQIPAIETKGFWVYNLMSQLVLPSKIKFVTNFSYITAKGNYYYFIANKPFNNTVDLSLSKKFLKDQLSISINADDIFNSNRFVFNSYNTSLLLSNKMDSRRFGFSINYKIPTKNKLARETPILLNKDKKEETGIIGN